MDPKNQYVASRFPNKTNTGGTSKTSPRKRDPKIDLKAVDPRIKQLQGVEIKPDIEIQPDTRGWYTRFECAQFLGVSITTIANYERSGRLHARHEYRRDNRGFEQRVAVYNPEELKTLRKGTPIQALRPEKITDPGELAASCFELFDQGKTFKEVVIVTRNTLDQVRDLYESWLDAGGADLTITPTAKEALQKIVGAFSSVADLLSLVEELAKKAGLSVEAPA
jgi:hypothetical protein